MGAAKRIQYTRYTPDCKWMGNLYHEENWIDEFVWHSLRTCTSTLVWHLSLILNVDSTYMIIMYMYSLNKKEWICSLFKEWILEKSEIRVTFGVNICVTCIHCILEWPQGSLGILSDPCGHSKNEWITQMFTPNSLQIHSNFTFFLFTP